MIVIVAVDSIHIGYNCVLSRKKMRGRSSCSFSFFNSDMFYVSYLCAVEILLF